MRRPEFAVEPSEAAPGNAIVTIVTLTPIMNMAIYEIVDGKIAAWRDYTNSAHAKKLLGL